MSIVRDVWSPKPRAIGGARCLRWKLVAGVAESSREIPSIGGLVVEHSLERDEN